MSTQANLARTAADERAVDLIRVLAMHAVQKAGSGHPGTAMSLAPAAYLLFQRLLREQPAAEGVSARVVSMPCVEWFDDQDESYRREVLPPTIRARVSVEAGITAPWRLFTGEAGASIGIDHYGASADYKTLYQEFGITAERVAAAARDSLARVTG